MKFGQALEEMKKGKKVRRNDWNKMFLFFNSDTLILEDPMKFKKVWQPLKNDLLANDWKVI